MSIEIIKSISKAQNGVVTRQQLLNSNVSAKCVRAFIEKGILMRVGKGVYSILGSEETWLHKATIAVFVCGSNSLLSHESVLRLYGLMSLRNDDFFRKRRPIGTRHLIHILNPRLERKEQEVFYHRTKKFLDQDAHNVYKGIPHVSIARAIVDCAQQLTVHELSYVVDQAIFRNLTTLSKILEAIELLHSGPGREKKRIKLLIDNISPSKSTKNVESYFEKRVENIIRKVCKYKISRQYDVNVSGNKYRLDFAIPEIKLAIEADGFNFHKDRLSFDNDKNRDYFLQKDGWLILHLTTSMTDLEIEDRFIEMIHLALQHSS